MSHCGPFRLHSVGWNCMCEHFFPLLSVFLTIIILINVNLSHRNMISYRKYIFINSLLMWWWHRAQQDATIYWSILIGFVCASFFLCAIDFKLSYSYNNRSKNWLNFMYTFLLLQVQKKNENQTFLDTSIIIIIMSIFCHVMWNLYLSISPSRYLCVRACVRFLLSFLIIMRRQIGLCGWMLMLLLFFFFSFCLGRRQNLGKG